MIRKHSNSSFSYNPYDRNDYVDKLLDTNIRAGGMACLWCIRSQLSKRLYAAFNKWRLNALMLRLADKSKNDYLMNQKKTPFPPVDRSIDNKQATILDEIPLNSKQSNHNKTNESSNENYSKKNVENASSTGDKTFHCIPSNHQLILSKLQENLDPEERRKLLLQISFGIIDRGKNGTTVNNVANTSKQSTPVPADTTIQIGQSNRRESYSSNDPRFDDRSYSVSHSMDDINSHRNGSQLQHPLNDRNNPQNNTNMNSIRSMSSQDYLSIDPTLFINLKRPSSRGSNLDLLAGGGSSHSRSRSNSHSNINNTNNGTINNENSNNNSNIMADSQSQKSFNEHSHSFYEQPEQRVNCDVVPIMDLKRVSQPSPDSISDNMFCDPSAGDTDGSITSRSQTLSNITYSSRSTEKSAGYNARRFSSPFSNHPSQYSSSQRYSNSNSSNNSNGYNTLRSNSSHLSGRSSLEFNSSNSTTLENSSSRLPITFKKSYEGEYVQGLLSPHSRRRLKAAHMDDPVLSRHSVMKFSLSSRSGPQPFPSTSNTLSRNRVSQNSSSSSGYRNEANTPRYQLATSSYKKKTAAASESSIQPLSQQRRGVSPQPSSYTNRYNQQSKPDSRGSYNNSSSLLAIQSSYDENNPYPPHPPLASSYNDNMLSSHNNHQNSNNNSPTMPAFAEFNHSGDHHQSNNYAAPPRPVHHRNAMSLSPTRNHYHSNNRHPEAQLYDPFNPAHSQFTVFNDDHNTVVRGRPRSASVQPSTLANRSIISNTSNSNGTAVGSKSTNSSNNKLSASMERAQLKLLYGDLDDVSEVKKKWSRSLRK